MRFTIEARELRVTVDAEEPPPDSVPPREQARAKRLPLRVVDTDGAEVIELDEVRRGT